MTEALDPNRPEAELQKLRLEIQKLTLDIASARKLARLDVALRLMPTAAIAVTVLGFMFTVWPRPSRPLATRLSAGKNDRSLALVSTLETSMLNTWNAKPDEFIKGQFVYR